jgi:hypothetical protein
MDLVLHTTCMIPNRKYNPRSSLGSSKLGNTLAGTSDNLVLVEDASHARVDSDLLSPSPEVGSLGFDSGQESRRVDAALAEGEEADNERASLDL